VKISTNILASQFLDLLQRSMTCDMQKMAADEKLNFSIERYISHSQKISYILIIHVVGKFFGFLGENMLPQNL
jgi:hypothetical protein